MDQNIRTVYADLFPLETTENEVKGLFSMFGKVKHINMPTFYHEHPLNRGHSNALSKGYAFIEYYTKDDAKEACDFFNDLDNILISHQRVPNNEAGGERPTANKDTRAKILDNPRHVALMPLRAMLKGTYLDLVRQFNEQKFRSLTRVAKSLAIL